MSDNLKSWLQELKYLPPIMRDFHDQKDIFKEIHASRPGPDSAAPHNMPNWIAGHIYVVDWFLYFMARRGYTLQKSRQNLPFVGFEGPPKAKVFPFKKEEL